jgi:hypothetical protein
VTVGRSKVTKIGEEEPGNAEPLVASDASCVGELLTRTQVAAVVLAPPAVTLKGMISPVEETSTSEETGLVAFVPVVYRNVRAGVLDPEGGGE